MAAARRPVLKADIHLRRGHRTASRARMARLATRPPTPQPAARARRGRGSVLRRGLAAVAAVPTELPPQLDDLLPQGSQFRGLLGHHRDQPRHHRIAAPFGRGGQTGDAVGKGRGGHGGGQLGYTHVVTHATPVRIRPLGDQGRGT